MYNIIAFASKKGREKKQREKDNISILQKVKIEFDFECVAQEEEEKRKRRRMRCVNNTAFGLRESNRISPPLFGGLFLHLFSFSFFYLIDKSNEHTCRIRLPLPSNGIEIEHGRDVGGKQEVKGTKSTREGKRERELERRGE